MSIIDKIKKLLKIASESEHVSDNEIAGLRASFEEMKLSKAAASRELDNIPSRRRDLLLNGAGDEQVHAVEQEAETLKTLIERCDLVMPGLEERLIDAEDRHRQKVARDLRFAYGSKFKAYLATYRQLLSIHDELSDIWDQVGKNGFNYVELEFPFLFRLSTMREFLPDLDRQTDRLCDPKAPLKIRSLRPEPVPASRFPYKLRTDHTAPPVLPRAPQQPTHNPFDPHLTPHGVQVQKLQAPATVGTEPKKKREPVIETPRNDGEVAIRLTKPGCYMLGDRDYYCGDIIALPKAHAELLLINGNAELFQKPVSATEKIDVPLKILD